MSFGSKVIFVTGLASTVFFSGSWALAEIPTYIAVGAAQTKKSVIAFPESLGEAALASEVSATVKSDLSFTDLFKFLPNSAFLEKTGTGILPGEFKLSDWSSVGSDFVLKTSLMRQPVGVALEIHLYEAASGKQLLNKKLIGQTSELKPLAHTLANEVLTALTGLPGIFQTKIAMVCDRTGKKEIYMMNFDGSQVRQVTQHQSTSFSPAWSPDGTRLAYSLFNRHRDNTKNIDLFEFNFTNNTIRMLSNRQGINSGSSYSPDGKKIALTMSFPGNPEIFTLDIASQQVTRITKSMGFDVDPSWSPDGKRLAFVSSRTGRPMVFSQNADGSNVQRLTFAGSYNASPSWSLQNNKIAFAGWLDRGFDIFIMNPDGTKIERLTKNQGSNEDPGFSPDGNFIAFSSNRTGQQNIYVVNVDGTFTRRLTYGLGNCNSPKWSNPPH